MARATKETPALVYVDTTVYIDLLVERTTLHPDPKDPRPRHQVALDVFLAAERGDIILAASSLVEAEIGCNYAAPADNARAQALLDGWFTAKSTQWIEIDRHLAREAVRLHNDWRSKNAVAKRKINTNDAIHLAAAVVLGCDYLMTQDGGFPVGETVEGVRVIYPTTIWPQSLLDAAAGE